MNQAQTELTKLVRFILGEKEIDEKTIAPGMHILYAEGVPAGVIPIDITTVQEVVEGRIQNGLNGFLGVTQCGQRGGYSLTLDHKLNATSLLYEGTSEGTIYDKARLASPQEVFVTYEKGILTFEWAAPNIDPRRGFDRIQGDIYKGPILIASKDPEKIRLLRPELKVSNLDQNTLEYVEVKDKFWRVVQRINNGQVGDFALPGFRQIPDDLYRQLTSEQFVGLKHYY